MNKAEFQESLSTSIREVIEGFSRSFATNFSQTTIKPPTFSGERSQDVVEWLDDYEQATSGLTEQTKRQILPSAFTKVARAWFKDELKPVIDQLDWEQIKDIILKRYRPNQEDYYIEQLNNLKFKDDSTQELASFVDQRIHISRLAYPGLGEREIVRDTILAMSPKVRTYLNLMCDTAGLTKVKDLKTLVARYDMKVDIPSPRDTVPTIDQSLFENLLKSAVDKTVEKLKIVPQTEVAAVARRPEPPPPKKTREVPIQQVSGEQQVTCHCQCQPSINAQGQPIRNMRPWQNQVPAYREPYQPYPYFPSQFIQPNFPYVRQYRPRRQFTQQPQQQYPQQDPNNNQQPETRTTTALPPSPCRNCGGNHWNRDCPKPTKNEPGC